MVLLLVSPYQPGGLQKTPIGVHSTCKMGVTKYGKPKVGSGKSEGSAKVRPKHCSLNSNYADQSNESQLTPANHHKSASRTLHGKAESSCISNTHTHTSITTACTPSCNCAHRLVSIGHKLPPTGHHVWVADQAAKSRTS